ncbi:MAG: O-acetyl-ADP-ribose deacetylase [Adhaeribacter sp.]
MSSNSTEKTWMDFILPGSPLVLFRGDITRVGADAIVNAANSSLLGGGGVDGAIHRAGGPQILEACRAIRARQGPCSPGEAVITPAGRLPARYVIHTVGPVWQQGNSAQAQVLANCYRNSLQLALDHGCRTVAFPNISTGVYGYPKDEAAQVAVEATRSFLASHPGLEHVIFVVFDEENQGLYQQLLQAKV